MDRNLKKWPRHSRPKRGNSALKRNLPALLAGLLLVALNVALIMRAPDWLHSARQHRLHGGVIHEATSDFAHIRVREKGHLRSLMFVESDGGELMQSKLDLHAPETLQLAYYRALFVSTLFQPAPARVLIVGLGGGGMVRFLESAMPETRIDAVEIDPAVVAIAESHFGTRSGPRVTIHTQDAFVYLRAPDGCRYEVIYMDAFLRPPDNAADLEEKAQRLKTTTFLREIRARLVEPGGLVAFNLIERERSTPEDLTAIRDVFPQVYEFAVAETGNLVVIASTDPVRVDAATLRDRAARLEDEFSWASSLSLKKSVSGLRPPGP